MKVSAKEIEVMFSKPAKDRYIYFIKRVTDWESAWTLGDDDAYVTTEDDNGRTSLPLWPAKEYAQISAKGNWDGLQLKEISLDELLDELLPQLIEDTVDLAIFMSPNEINVPTLPAKNVLKDLLVECEKYE
ncbi:MULTISPECIES: DUF2750 domain-containing protein [unclassified Brenneria]|uniref:DUF2750 domain-containing protein n=1 Tax=unclassified Brenneria TaxID=2634434 RepID=UPI0029C27820|nr:MULTISPECIES: DUF2750 domain-containing protein [unclassified Brenneria]MDX5631102.1 DUF2750 domain-containing protein [Brenneria sp. L3-3Z]MDX5698175.1 DUF2750 domain-containing protein [Brenneria sp. L4-2C]